MLGNEGLLAISAKGKEGKRIIQRNIRIKAAIE